LTKPIYNLFSMIPKPKRVLLPLFLLVLAAPALAEAPAPSDPERVRWLAEHALAVRSIEPADEDFADLMPLVRIIGRSRRRR
jgi:hypothetical protein